MLSTWHDFKNNMQYFWRTFLDTNTFHESEDDIDNDMDDLPLTLNKDEGPSVTYDFTENSEYARDQPKGPAFGIDSFGEDETFKPN